MSHLLHSESINLENNKSYIVLILCPKEQNRKVSEGKGNSKVSYWTLAENYIDEWILSKRISGLILIIFYSLD